MGTFLIFFKNLRQVYFSASVFTFNFFIVKFPCKLFIFKLKHFYLISTIINCDQPNGYHGYHLALFLRTSTCIPHLYRPIPVKPTASACFSSVCGVIPLTFMSAALPYKCCEFFDPPTFLLCDSVR